MPPVVISKQSSTTFADKEQIWADNASSSPFFGTVYVCWAAFRGQEKGNAAPAPLQVAVSHDGGTTWSQHQITAAANNGQRNPLTVARSAPTANGTAYVFGVGTVSAQGHDAFELMSRSTNGGNDLGDAAPGCRPRHAARRLRPGSGTVGDRRNRRRSQRPRACSERRHRQRRADGRRGDQPNRHDLRQWRDHEAARLLHGVGERR